MARALQLRHLFIFWCALVGALVFQIYGALLGFMAGYLVYFGALAVDGWTPEAEAPARRRFHPGTVITLIWLLATYNVVLAWLYLGGQSTAVRWVLGLAPFVEAFAPGVPAVARLGAQLAGSGYGQVVPLLTHIYVVDWMAALIFVMAMVLRHESALLVHVGRPRGSGAAHPAARPEAHPAGRGRSRAEAAPGGQWLFATAFFGLLFVLTLNWAVLGVGINFCDGCAVPVGGDPFGRTVAGLRDWTLVEALGVANQPHLRAGHYLPVLASIFLNLLLLFMLWAAAARLVLRVAQRHGYVGGRG